MVFRSNPASGVPVYLQLIEQVKHAIDVGALAPGDQLPAIRRVAEDLVINPNTVAKAYRDLEHEGVIELDKAPARSSPRTGGPGTSRRVKAGQPVIQAAIDRLVESGLSVDEIRRLFDAELLRQGDRPRARK